ncbi:MAG TPA: VWA domain-containing protein [Candidatus Limnocylindrales bacterium]|nr:VWA domain-containing protein [Candidatus Limnocylindrales bacterium]
MDFRFAEPGWGMLLWVVLAFTALLLWLDARAGGALTRFLSPAMQARLVRAPSTTRRRTSIVLLGLSFTCMVLALMRPQWGVQFVATPRVGAEIMVALDVSNSMLAEDVAPNRLERAKAELRDLLTYLQGDSVGLIAFAGRATVLAPLTPDFSFLRLVLDSAGPRSVSRGGTRLEEPIRKAVAGFAGAGAVSRSIILITDGEDHDSFPLEAAKEAAERGVKILAIGFGDENGSEIRITDPKTGARKPLRDASGKPVISRLDGELLREIALATGGAYIPAGTGVLDLQSIYDRHIASLTRGELDGQNRTIRNEAYQWCVLLALMFLVASVTASSSGRARRARAAAATTAAAAAAAVLVALAMPVHAQPQPAAPEPGLTVEDGAATAAEGEAADPAGTGAADGAGEPPGPPEDLRPPREIYNEGLARLDAGDLAGAAELLESARSKARLDNELRATATYNLGIVETRLADSKLEAQPEEALASLERAAAWFRDAVALNEKDQDARYNLELVLRRALVLGDSLAKKKEKSLLDELMALMEEQRTFLAGLRETMQQPDAADAQADEKLRRAYRALAARQLELGASAEDLSDRAGRERDTLSAKPADQQTPEDAMRASQLTGVLEYMHRARERIGQARGRLRRLEGEGAYRSASAVLTELKRARDQLLDPVQVLDVLIQDTLETARLSGAKAAIDAGTSEIEPQKWLTNDFLADSAGDMRERVEQLHYQFVAGLSQADAQKNSGQPLAPEQERFVERVREAEPHLGKAVASLVEAKPPLESGRVQESLEHQYRAVQSLASARERFLDFERLVELLAQDEQRIEAVLSPKEPVSEQALAEYAPLALEVQQSNIDRGRRAEQTLEEQLSAAQSAAAAAEAAQQQGSDPQAPAPPVDQQAAMEKQRLELAKPLLSAARTAMDDAAAQLSQAAAAASSGAVDWQPARVAVRTAVERIEDLRRLFFSVIEHLQELARRQVELGDSTEEVSALAAAAPDKDYADRAGPLGARQETLSQTARPIADALREQSQQPIPPEAQGQVPEDFPQRLAQAADHVTTAKTQMDGAAQGLSVNPPAFRQVREQQNAAVQSLAEALRLLQPPQEQQEQQQQDEQQQQQEQQQQEQQEQEQQQQQQGGQQQQQQQGGQEAADPAQLLQGIRDRDAKRRADKDRAAEQRYDPVEKDW